MGKDAYSLYIKANCRSLENTVEILDLFYYDTCNTNKGHWTIPSQATVTFGQNGLIAIGNTTSDVRTVLDLNYPTDYSLECEITDIGYGSADYSGGLIFNEVCTISHTSQAYISVDHFETSTNYKVNNQQLVSGDIIKLIKQNGIVSVYRNNTLLKSYSVSNNNGFAIRTYNNWKIGVKNLKIHEL